MKIGELVAVLEIRQDKASFRGARDDLGRFVKQSDSTLQALGKRMGKSLGNINAKLGDKLGNRFSGAAIGAGLVLAARDALKFDESLTRLDVSSRGAMGRMDQVRDKILGVSRATGVSKEDLVEGAAAFVALTGDGKAANEALGTFARVAVATGSSMQDIAGAAAAIRDQLGIGAPEFERAFSILVAGGKAGKIELKDMAALTASLAAQYKKFGGSQGTGGLATLGAAFQVTAKNFGSASEAATGLESLMGSLLQNSKQLKKEQGIDVFEKDGKTLRSLEAITEDISKKNLNASKVLGLLHRKEAVSTFEALRDNRKEWEAIRAATLRAKDIAEDYNKVQASSAARAARAWNGVKETIAASFTPERIKAFATALEGVAAIAEKIVQGITAVIDWGERVGGGTDSSLGQAATRGAGQAKGGRKGGNAAVAAQFMDLDRKGKTAFSERGIMDSVFSPKQSLSDALSLAAGTGGPEFLFEEGMAGKLRNLGPTRSPDPTRPERTLEPKGGGGVTVTAPITINAPNADGQGVFQAFAKHFDRYWDTKVRDLAENAGGE